jgi:hypothetical protein
MALKPAENGHLERSGYPPRRRCNRPRSADAAVEPAEPGRVARHGRGARYIRRRGAHCDRGLDARAEG